MNKILNSGESCIVEILRRQHSSVPVDLLSTKELKEPQPGEAYTAYIERTGSIDDKTWSEKLPLPIQRLRDRIYKRYFYKDMLSIENRNLIDQSACRLQFSCCNHIPYVPLIRAFGLQDTFINWFQLSLLHNWAVCTRLHVSMDAPSFIRFYRNVLGTFWADVDRRLDILYEKEKTHVNLSSESGVLHALHIKSLMNFEEGLLGDDRDLASAIWRSIYSETEFDPIYINRMVRYTRETIHFLNAKSANELLLNGISRWDPAEEIKANQLYG